MFNRTSSHVEQLKLPNVPVGGGIIDSDIHGPLAMLCDSLPTMEKLYILVW